MEWSKKLLHRITPPIRSKMCDFAGEREGKYSRWSNCKGLKEDLLRAVFTVFPLMVAVPS